MKRYPVILILLCLTALGMIAASAAPSENLRKKARYYYLEGMRLNALGRPAEAYEYYKKAYMVDSTYVEAAYAYGSLRYWLRTDTLQSEKESGKSLEMMRAYVDAYPTDVYEARNYAFSAELGDTLGQESIRIFERLDSLLPPDNTTLLNLAQSYMKTGRYDDALRVFDKYEKKDGKSPRISLNKMSIMLERGDTAAAINEATELVASNPAEPSFRILKGNLFEVIGDNDSTLAYYQQAEKLSPDNGPAKLALANYFREQGDSVAYDNKIYEALLTEDFELEDKLGILGDYLQILLNEKNDTQRGDNLFNVLMEQYPHEPEMLDLAARYSAAKGDFSAAAQQIRYAIDLDANNAAFWEKLMRYQYAGNQPKEAMATFKLAQDNIEITDDFRLLYAAAATEAEDYDTAIDTYADMIHAIGPSLPLTDSISDKNALLSLTYDNYIALNMLYSMLGDTYYREKKLDLTFKAYDNAIFFIPDNAMTLNNYAYFLTESDGDLDKALDYISKAITSDPENPTFLDTYAWVLFKRKDFKQALEYQKKAIDIATQKGEELSADYFHHLGDILFMNHEPAEALENWEKAFKLEPENQLLKKKVTHKTFFFE
ncbi:MAG: tetratricopeptide repeat protein [Muribaculaceae bacterium]|nr:tetratricopeptide repeat protein [Muribaculaceae bacterium]MDE6754647.1 tetratricopeptide repeat protein [Muribaculaceae bacterium]